MKFIDYLNLIDEPPTRWAETVGLSPATVWRASKGLTFPSPSTIRSIEQATKGAVRPEDWYSGGNHETSRIEAEEACPKAGHSPKKVA